MCRYDANVSGADLDNLHLSRCSAWESYNLRSQTAKTGWIIRSLKGRDLLRRRGEGEQGDAVEESNEDLRARYSGLKDRGSKIESDDRKLFCVIPDNDLVGWKLWVPASSYESHIVGSTQHFRGTDACIEVSRDFELAWV